MWNFLLEINRNGTTIVLTTHYLEEAENLCRQIAIIDHGRIIENTTMKRLLAKLHTETFVLDLDAPCGNLPESAPFPIRLVDPTTLEIDLDKSQDLNAVFALLSQCGVRVRSMRNKSNRLEELFLRLVGESEQEAAA
jgi:ABC-2 type transport system ATP-binding protein